MTKSAHGEITGLEFPATVEALIAAGPGFLTTAFQATGALPVGNRVVAIDAATEFFGGGMGRKLAFDVRYEVSDGALPTRLFAKFTREPGDPLHALFAPVMRPEVRFAMLSRQGDFPLTVPACCFADYDPDNMVGVLITERIPYGEDGIEPALDKCMDFALENPLEHYSAQAKAMARLAGHHRSGRLGSAIEADFPYDSASAAAARLIPFDAGQLEEKLRLLAEFAADAPALMPAGIRDADFLRAFRRDVQIVLQKEDRILGHLARQAELVALCHWNMNLDNAWFWRDRSGTLQSGQLDWGGVCQMNLAQSFYGMTCAAEVDFLAQHEDQLQQLVLDTYAAAGGPRVDRQAFATSVLLSTAVLGSAWMLDAPSLIAAEVPDYRDLHGRLDPRLQNVFIPRAQLQLMNVFLAQWKRHDIGSLIRGF